MNKQQLRRIMAEKLQQMTLETKIAKESKIAANLFNLAWWQEASVVGVTISRKNEINTRIIIEKGWEQQKNIVVPKCDPNSREMTFRILESFTQLEVVYFGLEEPIEAETKSVLAKEIDLLIVPGLAFTANGYRLGFGGGYYDRFLTSYNGKTVALAFEEQLVESVPIEEHDLPVDVIITNKRVVPCK